MKPSTKRLQNSRTNSHCDPGISPRSTLRSLDRFVAILLVLVVCIGFNTAAQVKPRIQPPRALQSHFVLADLLSPKDRIKVFEKVWETINEKYHDPLFNGVNWKATRARYRPLIETVVSDDQFYQLLKRMVGELNDSHTRFHTPRERWERKEQQGVSSGITVFEVEGRSVVVNVEPNSEASKLGVEPGMILRSVDGIPIETRIAQSRANIEGSSSERAMRLRLYRRILEGEPGSTLKLGLLRSDGTPFEVILTRRTVNELPTVNWRRLESGFGFIKLNVWRSPVHREFRRALESLKDSPGLIVDLRGNPGGVVDEVLEVASCFFPRRVPFGRFISRSGKSAPLYTDPDDDHYYAGPVAIIVNESSGSGSELFSGVMQEIGRAVVLGRQSCGCLLGITKFREFKGGGELAVSELAFVSPKGRRLEGRGVIPDEAVALTIRDLQSRRDVAVEKAENLLTNSPKRSISFR